MRLTCPNCAAHYEVDAALIPDEGRDVQCSNCGKTWFELPASSTPVEDEPSPVVTAPVADSIKDTPVDEGDASDWEEPAEDTQEEATTSDDDPEEEEARPAPIAPALKKRDVDPRALDILKEEADRELETRKKERASVEVQSEFDLTAQDDGEEPSRALRARMARLRGESDPRPQRARSRQSEGGGYAPPERELLPDIDEINSSLRPPDTDADALEAEQKAGFRRGFGMMIGLAATLIILYIAAPAISQALPGLTPTMVAYLDAANGFRDFVDGIIR
jgi:predicted Zn finger-like uncharacterized protein